MKPGYANDKEALLKRLSRIEGQVRGVSRMVSEDTYCIDVLTQIAAIKAALDEVGMRLLEDHVNHCVVESVRNGDDARVGELVNAVKRYVRT